MEVEINRKSVSSSRVYFHEIKAIFPDGSYLLADGVVDIEFKDKFIEEGDDSLSNGTRIIEDKEITDADAEITNAYTIDGEALTLPNTTKTAIEEKIEEEYKQLQFID